LINSSDQQKPASEAGANASTSWKIISMTISTLSRGIPYRPGPRRNSVTVQKQVNRCPLPIKTDSLPLGPDIISGHKIGQDERR
jgi:hypothetical protein